MISRLFSDDWQMPIAIGAGVALLVGMSLQVLVDESVGDMQRWFHAVGHGLVWVSLALGAVHGVKAAGESLRERKPDIDVLMVVGAGLAALINHPGEGALLLFMFTLAGALEHRALAKAKDAVARLSRLMPNEALRKAPGGGGWEPVKPDDLAVGDVVLVRPGETVPADARVVRGHTTVDQSALTGESLPRNVDEGDEVFAGTLNQAGVIEAEVTRPIAESSLQRITELVLEAQEQRQPMQRIIDRYSTPYTLSVFAFAGLAFVGFAIWGEGLAEAAIRAITLLIVASPCALVIATPTATLCGLNRAARGGLLVKGGETLERLANVGTVVVDKTGTLTTGQIEVTNVSAFPDGGEIDDMLPLALAIEERSTHPIAAAIARFARSRGARPAEIDGFSMVAGRGIEAESGGAKARIGTIEFVAPSLPEGLRPDVEEAVARARTEGEITAAMSVDGRALVFALADTVRPGAQGLIEGLREQGVDRVIMLTGDFSIIAERMASQLGIDEVHAELLPELKVAHVRALRHEIERDGNGRGLAVVGDGVNDAPSLAAADVGLAMGGVGADAALEAADVVILSDDLDVVPWSLWLARRVRRIMLANLVFAISVIVVLAVCALIGVIPISIGVIGHEGSTLIVVGNSLQILGLRGAGPRAEKNGG